MRSGVFAFIERHEPTRSRSSAKSNQVRCGYESPERRQMELVPQCTDDLVSPTHAVRRRCGGGEIRFLYLPRGDPSARRTGRAGRHRSRAIGGVVAVWLHSGHRVGAELARKCEESLPFRRLCGGVSVNHRMLSGAHVVRSLNGCRKNSSRSQTAEKRTATLAYVCPRQCYRIVASV